MGEGSRRLNSPTSFCLFLDIQLELQSSWVTPDYYTDLTLDPNTSNDNSRPIKTSQGLPNRSVSQTSSQMHITLHYGNTFRMNST